MERVRLGLYQYLDQTIVRFAVVLDDDEIPTHEEIVQVMAEAESHFCKELVKIAKERKSK